MTAEAMTEKVIPVLPGGNVTFFLTDIENNVGLKVQYPQAMHLAFQRHLELAQVYIEHPDSVNESYAPGIIVKERCEGDGLFAAFANASDALAAACALQRALLREPWGRFLPSAESSPLSSLTAPFVLKVRMGLHTGEHINPRGRDYLDIAVDTCARLREIAQGGETLLSAATMEQAGDQLPAAATLRDHGIWRLRGLPDPMQVYRLQHPEIPALPPRGNIPPLLDRFVGREAEREELRCLLAEHRLVTLTGVGGAGKTRLALEVASELRSRFREGGWLVRLDSITDPSVVQAVARVLDAAETSGKDLLTSVVDLLGTRELLLVLDNCEHLVSGCGQLVQALLELCPRVRILATSRHRLNLRGERVWKIPLLALPEREGRLSPAELMKYAAIQLFVTRAQSTDASFRLTDQNAEQVARLCRQLDGMPFALELAAALTKVLTVGQILDRVQYLYEEIAQMPVRSVGRASNLDALLNLSYELLSEKQRELLRRLSVFAGGWTLEAAAAGEAMLEERRLLETLWELVNHSLVKTASGHETKRFSLLETVRAYARAKLEKAGEEEVARERHLEYFLLLTEEAENHLTGPEQKRWLDRLDIEHDNLRAALAWATPENRLLLAGRLWRFWLLRGYYTEGRSWLEGAMARASQASPAWRARALNGLGVLASRLSDSETALKSIEQSLPLWQQAGDANGEAEALNILSTIHYSQGSYAEALEVGERSLNLYRQNNNRWGEAAALNNAGRAKESQGDLKGASACYQQCLEIYRVLQDSASMIRALCNLAGIAYDNADYARACHYEEEALRWAQELGERGMQALLLGNLAETRLHMQQWDRASAMARDSLQIYYKMGSIGEMTLPLDTLGKIACEKADYERAACLLGAASAIRQLRNTNLAPQTAEDFETTCARVRQALGEERSHQFWMQGAHMPLEALYLYALQERE